MKQVTTYVGIDAHEKDLFIAMLIGQQEAGPCGYVLPRQVTTSRVSCDVIAPALISAEAGWFAKLVRFWSQETISRGSALKICNYFDHGYVTLPTGEPHYSARSALDRKQLTVNEVRAPRLDESFAAERIASSRVVTCR